MDKKSPFPKLPHTFFKWYCRPDRYEEIHGDLEELFFERVSEKGATKARLYYLLDVIRCCQPYAWKKSTTSSSPFMMFKNYYTTSMRILVKNPLNSFINIAGLTVAIGICVWAYAFWQWVNRLDQFHVNKNEVYLVTFFSNRDGALQQIGKSPRPLGEMLRQDFPEIKEVCRIEDNNVVLKYEDKVFHEKVRFVDPSFLTMFTFPLKWGSVSSLGDLNSIILSEDMSVKYFGEENPLGKDFEMIFGENRSKRFKVAGVAAAFPKAHIIDFNFLINFDNLRSVTPDYAMSDWKALIKATLIQVPDSSQLKWIEKGMAKYKHLQNEVEEDWAIASFAFEPLATLYKHAGTIKDDISRNSYSNNAKSIIFQVVISLFMLALACFNYINIAIVSASKRLKEIGVRKSIGATRRKVIVQFLSENMLLTGFALILGVAFGGYVFIPWFEHLNDFSMDFQIVDKTLWIFLLLVLVVTGLLSGIYPALYISRFQVSRIFKGSVELGRQNPLSKLFLGFQLILACILITGAVMFTQNSDFIARQDWGYDPESVLYSTVHDPFAFERLQSVMERNANVVSIAGSVNHLGKNHSNSIIHTPEHSYEVHQLAIDAQYFQTLRLRLAEGRSFRPDFESDKHAVVVNEQVVKNMALKHPIGQHFEMDSIRYEIIGVVEDFHSYDFSNKVPPTIFKLAAKEDYQYLSMRVRSGSEKETYKALQAEWLKLFPEIPFQGGYQQDVWGGYFNEMGIHGRFWRMIASIAVLLAGLGLYGLVTLNVSGRMKEFSIRKVLGADTKNITMNILNQYMILFAVALLLGAPISYVLAKMVLNFAYIVHVPVDSLGVTISVATLLLVLLLVVSTQVKKVLVSSPVQGLKSE